jgi:periplasmic protein TonB
MFQDSLIESGEKLKTKRGMTTMLSFSFQAAFVAVLILIPLLYTEALPKLRSTISVAPPPPPAPPRSTAAVKVIKIVQTDIVQGKLRAPAVIPKQVKMIAEEEAPPAIAGNGVVDSVQSGRTDGQGGVISSIVSSAPMADLKIVTPRLVRVSQGVTAGLLTRKVQPTYPPLARQARIQGVVVLQAEISKDGAIQNLFLISGHPMLVPAAIEAVKQWRYRPYILNGEPVAVETQITVNFTLSAGNSGDI